jgi:hypothetical protein
VHETVAPSAQRSVRPRVPGALRARPVATVEPRSVGGGPIGAYQRCCTQLVEHRGSFIAKYMGDGVLAYFGYPERMSMMPNSRCAPGSVLSTRFQKLVTNAGSRCKCELVLRLGS